MDRERAERVLTMFEKRGDVELLTSVEKTEADARWALEKATGAIAAVASALS